MNLADIFLAAAIAVSLALAIRKCVKDRRQGKSCCGDCAGCVYDCKKREEKQ